MQTGSMRPSDATCEGLVLTNWGRQWKGSEGPEKEEQKASAARRAHTQQRDLEMLKKETANKKVLRK